MGMTQTNNFNLMYKADRINVTTILFYP